jgi:hypothetical protein
MSLYGLSSKSLVQPPSFIGLVAFEGILEARPAGFEPATRGLEVRCSVLLSYGRSKSLDGLGKERVRGIEPPSPAWKAGALPLSYTRSLVAFMVGARGFEPPTPCSQSRCANQAAPRPVRSL